MLRKTVVSLSIFLLLTGCGGKAAPDQEALRFRTELMEAGGCSFAADVTASYEDRVYAFSLNCRYEEGKMTLEVTAPENIAGICAEVEENAAFLEFDGAQLDFGKLANGRVSPVAAPWLLAECWLGEYIAWAGADGGQQRVTYLRGYHDDELTVDTWFSQGIPTYAEIACDGVRCLTIAIKEYQ